MSAEAEKCPDCEGVAPCHYSWCPSKLEQHSTPPAPPPEPIDERAAFEKCARILFPHLFSPNVPSQISKVLGAAQALKNGQERLWMLWRQARASLERK